MMTIEILFCILVIVLPLVILIQVEKERRMERIAVIVMVYTQAGVEAAKKNDAVALLQARRKMENQIWDTLRIGMRQ